MVNIYNHLCCEFVGSRRLVLIIKGDVFLQQFTPRTQSLAAAAAAALEILMK